MTRRNIINWLIPLAMLISIANAQPYTNLAGGINDRPVLSLYADTANNLLYVGGEFSLADGIKANAIAKWNGTAWDSLRNQIDSPPFSQVRGITKFNNKIYLAGPLAIYDTLGILSGLGLVSWNDSNHYLEGGVFSFLQSVYSNNSDLYALGQFDSIGGIYSPKIARYDGTTWYAYPPLDTVGGGFGSNTAQVYNGELYVGGNFERQQGPNMRDIAKFNGTNWVSVGGGLSGPGTIARAFTIYQNKLIVGGYFLTAFGDPGNCILSWDGSTWGTMGSGLQNSGEVRCLQVYNNELWAGGGFFNAGGLPVTYIAKWDGTQWHNVGAVLDNVVTSMAVMGNDLYIGGAFLTCNGDSVNHIVKYNPNTGFEALGNKKNEVRVFPNPTTQYLQINFNDATLFENVSIINSRGQTVKQYKQTGKQIFVNDLPAGIYTIRFTANGMERGLKFSVAR